MENNPLIEDIVSKKQGVSDGMFLLIVAFALKSKKNVLNPNLPNQLLSLWARNTNSSQFGPTIPTDNGVEFSQTRAYELLRVIMYNHQVHIL